MPGPTPHYPPEFKREAVQLYRSSERSIPKVAQELGIAEESLRRWIRQHEIDQGRGVQPEAGDEGDRIRELAAAIEEFQGSVSAIPWARQEPDHWRIPAWLIPYARFKARFGGLRLEVQLCRGLGSQQGALV